MTTRWVAPPTADLTKCNPGSDTGSCGPGLTSNTGTKTSPWSFAKACGTSGAQPGDIVEMRGGTYTGQKYSCTGAGSAGNRITFRGYGGDAGTFASREWPVLDSYAHTTLNAAMINATSVTAAVGTASNCSTPIPLASTAGLTSGMTLTLEEEQIVATTISGGAITACTRANPVAHGNGSRIYPACSSVPIQLASGANFPNNSEILIDEEWIMAYTVSGNNITSCARNWSIGSPGGFAAHSAGADVVLSGNAVTLGNGGGVQGRYVTFRDFQITNSWPTRAWPTLFKGRGEGIFLYAPDNELINLILDNCQEGIYQQDGACNSLTYGCIIHSNGNVGNDRGHGHSAYLHNSGSGCVAEYKNLILFNSYGFGVHAYASSVQIINMHFDQIISFNAGVPAAYSGSPAAVQSLWSTCLIGDNAGVGPANCSITNSYLWQPPGSVVSGGELQIGISGGLGDGFEAHHIYAVGGTPVVSMTFWTNVDLHDNTFINCNTGTGSGVYSPVNIHASRVYAWDNNDIWDMRDEQSGYRSSFTILSDTIPGCCFDHLGALVRDARDASGKGTNGATVQFRSDSTLVSNINNSQISITVAPGTGGRFTGSGAIARVDNERVRIDFITGDVLTLQARGVDGTTAVSHSAGAVIGLLFGSGSPSPNCSDGSCNSPRGTGWVNWSQGLDANSTYHEGVLPTTTVSECFANTYETGRGHCIVINWANTSTVSLNLSGLGFSSGDSFAIWDVQNFVPWTTASAIKTGTYSAASPTVTAIPFAALNTVIKPIGSPMTPAHTAQASTAKMATYVIRRTATSGAAPAPTLSTISPNSGIQGTAPSCTLTGANFVIGATTVAISGSGVTISGTSVASTTSLTATFTIAAGAATGARTVTVTTTGGQSSPVTFTVNAAPTPGPDVTSISPNSGTVGTAVNVTLTGTNFVGGSTTVAVAGGGVTVGSISVTGTTSVATTFTIASGATVGARVVTVTTPNGFDTITFTLTAVVIGPPTLTGISPTVGFTGSVVAMTLTGTNFVTGTSTINISGSGVTSSAVSVVSPTSITALFTITGGAAVGVRTVSVTVGTNGTTQTQNFTVIDATAAPGSGQRSMLSVF